MANMTVADALRIASIFEADDIIAVPAMACRVLAKYVKELEEKNSELNSALEREIRDRPFNLSD